MAEVEVNTPVKIKKVLTDEEKEKRRNYNRSYMAKRREDPEFLARQQESCRKSHKRPEAKAKERTRNTTRKDYFSLYHLDKKTLVTKIRELEDQLKISDE